MTDPTSAHECCTVVLVDDDPLSLALLRHLVEDIPGTRVLAFGDPVEAEAWCRRQEADLVITDHEMPHMTGTELVRRLREVPGMREVPVLMVTTNQDREVRREALSLGANDYLPKPLDAVEAGARIRNMLALRRSTRALARHAASLEAEVRRATEAITAREHEAIVRLARAAEFRDWETGAHIVRVAWYARLIARMMDLAPAHQDALFRAAPMHDVGKIGVPDYILLKPSGLDDAEFEIMKQHTVVGHRILTGSASDLLRMAADIALSHHERYDGSGYPERLAGEAIPLSGRIVAVADTFDALTSERPYKNEWPVALATEHLRQNSGTRFDPDCVRAFLAALGDVEEIRASFPDPRGKAGGRPVAVVPAAEAERRYSA
jgi:response regulator RpfG family c-di-GMP phosphodiesterase